MSQRNGFRNIQIQAKTELYESFEETYRESGANTKAELLNWLLESYLNSGNSDSADSKKVNSDNEALRQEMVKTASERDTLSLKLNKADEEKEILLQRLALYETDQMKDLLKKHKGEKLSFRNANGKKVTIEINDLPDIFSAIFNSVEIN